MNGKSRGATFHAVMSPLAGKSKKGPLHYAT